VWLLEIEVENELGGCYWNWEWEWEKRRKWNV